MRIFIGLDIPAEIRERLHQYVERIRSFSPAARWARVESLHVTLKFIGEVSEAKIQEIQRALVQIKAQPFEIEFKDIGFFPSARSARVFWAGATATDALPQLVSMIEESVDKLGIAREKRAYHAHLTLARAPEHSASEYCFRLLQERLAAEESPRFGTMSAQEFFLYHSQIMRGGARYTKLQRFPLE
jgi:2'-5' RNA ligase